MMNDEQVCPVRNGQFDGGQAGIHGGRNARDRTGIFHLEPIHGAGVVADFAGAQNSVAMLNEGG